MSPQTSYKCTFHIINRATWPTHAVLGRDFLVRNNLSLVYNPLGTTEKERLELIKEVASADIISENPSDIASLEISSDFGKQVDEQIREVILEVQSKPIEKPKEDYYVKVRLKDDIPFAYPARRFAWTERQEIDKLVEDLRARDIIQDSTSPYCSRIVLVRKKNGKLRLCVDLRPLNAKVIKQHFSFPIIEELMAQLANKKVLTVLDLRESFHSIKIHPDHTRFFSFATPSGQFEYKRLPFGFCEAPAEFQRQVINILQPLIREGKVLIYINDILIHTDSVEKNFQIFKQVLQALHNHSLEVNFAKCQLFKRRIEYLGYIIDKDSVTLSDRHLVAIKNFPAPRNVCELQRFLGLVNYFRKFIMNLATIAKPLYSLLKKAIPYNFDNHCLDAFNRLKSALISKPILCHYNPRAETELHSDASTIALAAILFQKQANGKFAPIAYFSQATNAAESRYHSFELEMLAVLRAIERFHIYVYGLEFTIVTDCNALVFASTKADINPRIARWMLKLQNYRYKMLHRKAEKMCHVDALSRIVAALETIPLDVELRCKQQADPRLRDIASSLEDTESDYYALVEGLVYKKCKDKKLRFVVPEAMVPNIIRIYHDQCAHCGPEKTAQGIYSNYWFPSVRKRVNLHIDNCLTCLLANTTTHSKEGENHSKFTPKEPMNTLHTDHFGPLIESNTSFKHILLLVDAFTRFTWLFPVKTTSSKETISKLVSIFDTFGNPSVLVSDRGTAFSSFEFSDFLKNRNIDHRMVAVAAPWANGLVERINRFLKASLRKMIDEQVTWSEKIKDLQYILNNTYHTSIRSTPSKLLLGYDIKNHSDSKLTQFLSNLHKESMEIQDRIDLRDKDREIALQASDHIKKYNKSYYDSRHQTPTKYNVGDYIVIKDSAPKAGVDKKLHFPYKGPYRIEKVLDNDRYIVQDIPGYQLTQKPYHGILSSDRIKPWIPIPKD